MWNIFLLFSPSFFLADVNSFVRNIWINQWSPEEITAMQWHVLSTRGQHTYALYLSKFSFFPSNDMFAKFVEHTLHFVYTCHGVDGNGFCFGMYPSCAVNVAVNFRYHSSSKYLKLFYVLIDVFE